MTEPIDILCVDDNAAFADSIRLLVEAEPDMKWIGHLPSAERLPELVEDLAPSIVLLDLSMPGPHPLEVLRELLAGGSQVRAIVVSGFLDARHIIEAVDAGAWGYVSKHESLDAIFDAIRRVVAGEVDFPKLEPVSATNCDACSR